MDDDFSEFCDRVGTEVSIYRECPGCGDIIIVNTETYDKPKLECDPGFCPYSLPMCLCRGEEPLYSDEEIEACTYPNCSHGHG